MFSIKKIVVAATLLIAIAGMTTFQSCKKDDDKIIESMEKPSDGENILYSKNVKDMNVYLKDFVNNMRTNKTDEMLTLADAEWHLTNIANYEYANVVAEYSDIQFDTLYSNVSITNGQITMSDLNEAYNTIASQLCNIYKGLNFDNKNLRYINSVISEDGNIVTSTIFTYNSASKLFYFSNNDYCDLYFSEDSSYVANDLGMTELKRLFNLLEGKPLDTIVSRIYYTSNREKEFYYADYYDSIAQCYRLFHTDGFFYAPISKDDMCYYLDSYLGLAEEYELNAQGNCIIKGNLEFEQGALPKHECTGHHLLTVTYGFAVAIVGPPLF